MSERLHKDHCHISRYINDQSGFVVPGGCTCDAPSVNGRASHEGLGLAHDLMTKLIGEREAVGPELDWLEAAYELGYARACQHSGDGDAADRAIRAALARWQHAKRRGE